MPATITPQRAAVERETTTVVTIRLARAATAPALARRHVQREVTAPMPARRLHHITLLTSELVTNAVQHSRAGAIEVSVGSGGTLTRIEVSNPGQRWSMRPAVRSRAPDEAGGWGLFMVEQLSDRWGVRDRDCTVWFELDCPQLPARPGYCNAVDVWAVLRQVRYPASREDLIDAAVAGAAPPATVARLEALTGERYEDAEQVSQELVDRRVESNPALVAITAEACERCGFPRKPGEPHSCIEEKARFADSANAVSDEFDAIDERARRNLG